MNRTSRKRNFRTAVIWIGVVACLCFSLGEGLRLTPFPVCVVSEIEGLNESDNSLQRYGPLDKPSRSQTRTKRPVVDYAFAPPVFAGPTQLKADAIGREGPAVHSIHSGSPPIGRAPPSC